MIFSEGQFSMVVQLGHNICLYHSEKDDKALFNNKDYKLQTIVKPRHPENQVC